jgi:alginate O-acetyltransferase complex protein AlgI
MLTMLIGGLWHGASWTFVVWGGLHGAYLAGERLARRLVKPSPLWTTIYARAFLILLTFTLVCFAWVFFRATSFDQAFRLCRAMLGDGPGATHGAFAWALLPVGGLIAAHVAMRDTTLEVVAARAAWPVRAAVLTCLVLALVLFPGVDRAFIYFQF